ncbi:unnamed protein product [Periconia digitata]|uniref:Uncharacterized protein n=1 Tax=Periconia digitata TaxID=1303443 RepID=A0A9W4ULN7_9PLEO|nr:unnamed protein product [Periconia digitata]
MLSTSKHLYAPPCKAHRAETQYKNTVTQSTCIHVHTTWQSIPSPHLTMLPRPQPPHFTVKQSSNKNPIYLSFPPSRKCTPTRTTYQNKLVVTRGSIATKGATNHETNGCTMGTWEKVKKRESGRGNDRTPACVSCGPRGESYCIYCVDQKTPFASLIPSVRRREIDMYCRARSASPVESRGFYICPSLSLRMTALVFYPVPLERIRWAGQSLTNTLSATRGGGAHGE